MSDTLGLALALGFLLGNALFVGAEFGLIAARRSEIELKARAGSRAAKVTLSAMENVSLMLAGAQLGITLCSLGLGALGEPIVAHLLEKPFSDLGIPEIFLHPSALVLALSLITYIHVVIGEMVPKNIAIASPTRTAMLFVPPLVVFVRILHPFIVGLNRIANGFLRLFNIEVQNEITSAFTSKEVAGLIQESHKEGLLTDHNEKLISGALHLEETITPKVLLSPATLVTVPHTVTPAKVLSLAAETGYSRFPVLDGDAEFSGYVHLKDMLEIKYADYQKPLASKFIRPLAAIKEGATLRTALSTMQRAGSHLARVSIGGIAGIVTLEDILEEFVGEIQGDIKA